eukprot:8189829-Prorocentrum_lima.AAC.1
MFKELHADNLEDILALLNDWWLHCNMPHDVLLARVVLIFKKGDKRDLANYRPISLLNNFYKLFATVLQRRLASVVDPHLQATQYGFRSARGTRE